MKFEEMDTQQRAGIVNNRTNVTLSVDRETAEIVGVEGFVRSPILPTHVEIPPSPVVLTEENAAKIFALSGDGPRGKWNRFFIMVYFNGGRIFFKELDQNQLEVVVQFL